MAPAGSPYVDQRHYVLPASLAELRGPASGVVTLDRRLDWSGDGAYDLDDPGDLQVMYQTVLNQAATVADLHRWLDCDTLRRLCRRGRATGLVAGDALVDPLVPTRLP